MTIYQYPDTETLILAPIFVVIPLLLIGIFVYFLISNRKKQENGQPQKIFSPISQLTFIVPLCAIIIMAIFMFPMCFKVFRLHYLAERNEGERVQGSPEILEITENRYRDDFQGYTLRIKIGETELSPENSFSEEVIDALEKQPTVTVYYDESNGELYILKIVADSANP